MKSVSLKIVSFFIPLFLIASCQPSSEKEETKSATANTATDKKETAIPAKADATKWKADASKANIKFTVDGPFGTVNGSFTGLKSTILFDEKDLSSSFVEASVDAKTISTGIKLRNSDLQKEKYLDANKNPSISFRSEKIQKEGDGYKAIGQLTLKGTKKSVEIPFHFAQKGNSGVFKGSFKINRNDYNIGKEGGSIGKTVSIDLEVPVTK